MPRHKVMSRWVYTYINFPFLLSGSGLGAAQQCVVRLKQSLLCFPGRHWSASTVVLGKVSACADNPGTAAELLSDPSSQKGGTSVRQHLTLPDLLRRSIEDLSSQGSLSVTFYKYQISLAKREEQAYNRNSFALITARSWHLVSVLRIIILNRLMFSPSWAIILKRHCKYKNRNHSNLKNIKLQACAQTSS